MMRYFLFVFLILNSFFLSAFADNTSEVHGNTSSSTSTSTATSTSTQVTAAVDAWIKEPQLISFKEFKYLKNMPDKDKKALIFVKQKQIYYSLAQPFQSDQTKICYGTMRDAKNTKYTGVACVLSEVNAESCAKVSLKKCADDPSIIQIEEPKNK